MDIKMDILTSKNQCLTKVQAVQAYRASAIDYHQSNVMVTYRASVISNNQSNVIIDYRASATINYQLNAKVNRLTSKVNKLMLIRLRIYLHLQMASCVLSASKHFQFLKIHLPLCFGQGEKCSPKSAFFKKIINFKGLQQMYFLCLEKVVSKAKIYFLTFEKVIN
jgi:hypothetical protein